MKRVVLLGLLLGAFAVDAWPASASCAGPWLDTDNRLVTPGDDIVITGEFWMDDCNDTGAIGCSLESEAREPEPYRDVLLMLKRPGHERFYELGRVDANEDGELALRADVPDVPAGRYRLIGQVGSGYRISADGFVTVQG
jgi:hypothetical protein